MADRILITGVTGFVGSHLADYLFEKHQGVDLWATKRWHLSRMDNVWNIKERLKWYDCDLTDPIAVRDMIGDIRPQAIYHMAAESFVSPSWKHPHRYMSVNYGATVNLLDAIQYQRLTTRILLPGSGEEYGEIYDSEIPITEDTSLRPVNPYAVTKIAQDLIGYVYFKSYGTNVIRVRTFNHEGPRRDKVFGIPWYAYQIARIEAQKQPPQVKVGYIDDVRNFTHVRDVVEAYVIACKKCNPGELYLIGSSDNSKVYTFRQALEILISMSPISGIRYETDERYVRPTNVPRLIGDTSRFCKLTGWEPRIPFDQILRDTLEYWRARVAAGA